MSPEVSRDEAESDAVTPGTYVGSGAAPAPADESGAPAPEGPGATDAAEAGGTPEASAWAEAHAEPDVPAAPGPPEDPGGTEAHAEPDVPAAPGPPDDAGRAEAHAEPDAASVSPSAAWDTDARPDAAAGLEPGGPPPAGALPEAAATDLDAPLLADVEGLRTSWHRIQAGFVDDPREAVADAANLVEHTAQALVGALQQRQRLLRASWDRGRTLGGLEAPEDVPDTEQLRLLIQHYRILFNHICPP